MHNVVNPPADLAKLGIAMNANIIAFLCAWNLFRRIKFVFILFFVYFISKVILWITQVP